MIGRTSPRCAQSVTQGRSIYDGGRKASHIVCAVNLRTLCPTRPTRRIPYDSPSTPERAGVPDSATVREPSNVADLVRRAAAGSGAGKPALIWQDQMLTWVQLDGLVDGTARALLELGLPGAAGGGDAATGYPARVGIVLANVPAFAVAYFGALRAGLVAVPVNPGYTSRELRQVLADCGASVLIGPVEVPAGVAVPHRFVAPPQAPGEPVESPTGGEDLAVLIYTSGSEGDPKGAMLSHRALLANHEQLSRVEPPPVGTDDILLLALPLFHAYGLNSGLGAVAYHGATGVLM